MKTEFNTGKDNAAVASLAIALVVIVGAMLTSNPVSARPAEVATAHQATAVIAPRPAVQKLEAIVVIASRKHAQL